MGESVAMKRPGAGKPIPSLLLSGRRGTKGASLGAKLKQGHPIARDLRVGRMKPLETVVEVRSSADPQIACVTCA